MGKYLNLRTNIAFGLIFAFLANTVGPMPVYALETQNFASLRLPAPGEMVSLSPAFSPAVLKGIKLDPKNPFRFHFFVDRGDTSLSQEELKQESSKLIKYFLASLTIPEKDLWVNLSPYEKDRIVPPEFGQTEMGRDLLAEDYLLKQITASLIYPESQLGKEFWKKVYAEAQAKYGTTNIPINTFNKVWIVPEKAVVYENKGTAFVLENHLKVMLEQDYLSLQKHTGIESVPAQAKDTNQLGSQIVREIVIPALTKEVNEGKNFSQLRQVFYSLILATWYKKKIKDSILNKVYSNRNKIGGVDVSAGDKDKIYQGYLKAFKKGVYNYIKEEAAPATNEVIPRKYFSGGVQVGRLDLAMIVVDRKSAKPADLAELTRQTGPAKDSAMTDVGGDFNLVHSVSQAMKTALLVSPVTKYTDTVVLVHPINEPDIYFRLMSGVKHRFGLEGSLWGIPPDWVEALKLKNKIQSSDDGFWKVPSNISSTVAFLGGSLVSCLPKSIRLAATQVLIKKDQKRFTAVLFSEGIWVGKESLETMLEETDQKVKKEGLPEFLSTALYTGIIDRPEGGLHFINYHSDGNILLIIDYKGQKFPLNEPRKKGLKELVVKIVRPADLAMTRQESADMTKPVEERSLGKNGTMNADEAAMRAKENENKDRRLAGQLGFESLKDFYDAWDFRAFKDLERIVSKEDFESRPGIEKIELVRRVMHEVLYHVWQLQGLPPRTYDSNYRQKVAKENRIKRTMKFIEDSLIGYWPAGKPLSPQTLRSLPSDVRIVSANEGDVEELLDFRKHEFASKVKLGSNDRGVARKWLVKLIQSPKDGFILLAKSEGRTIGYAVFELSSEHGIHELSEMATLGNLQRTGIGTQLMLATVNRVIKEFPSVEYVQLNDQSRMPKDHSDPPTGRIAKSLGFHHVHGPHLRIEFKKNYESSLKQNDIRILKMLIMFREALIRNRAHLLDIQSKLLPPLESAIKLIETEYKAGQQPSVLEDLTGAQNSVNEVLIRVKKEDLSHIEYMRGGAVWDEGKLEEALALLRPKNYWLLAARGQENSVPLSPTIQAAKKEIEKVLKIIEVVQKARRIQKGKDFAMINNSPNPQTDEGKTPDAAMKSQRSAGNDISAKMTDKREAGKKKGIKAGQKSLIIYVDDDESTRISFKEWVQRLGDKYVFKIFETQEKALDYIKSIKGNVNLVISDTTNGISAMQGPEFADELKRRYPKIPFVAVSNGLYAKGYYLRKGLNVWFYDKLRIKWVDIILKHQRTGDAAQLTKPTADGAMNVEPDPVVVAQLNGIKARLEKEFESKQEIPLSFWNVKDFEHIGRGAKGNIYVKRKGIENGGRELFYKVFHYKDIGIVELTHLEAVQDVMGTPKILNWGKTKDDRVWIEMEGVKNSESIEVWEDNKERFSKVWSQLGFAQRLDVLAKVAEILTKIHQKGISHNDVKPRNIVINSKDDVMLIDWDLANTFGQEQKDGTEPYVAEEPIKQDQSDVYSLSVTIREALGLYSSHTGEVLEGLFPNMREIATVVNDLLKRMGNIHEPNKRLSMAKTAVELRNLANLAIEAERAFVIGGGKKGSSAQLTKPTADLPAEASPASGTKTDAAMNSPGASSSAPQATDVSSSIQLNEHQIQLLKEAESIISDWAKLSHARLWGRLLDKSLYDTELYDGIGGSSLFSCILSAIRSRSIRPSGLYLMLDELQAIERALSVLHNEKYRQKWLAYIKEYAVKKGQHESNGPHWLENSQKIWGPFEELYKLHSPRLHEILNTVYGTPLERTSETSYICKYFPNLETGDSTQLIKVAILQDTVMDASKPADVAMKEAMSVEDEARQRMLLGQIPPDAFNYVERVADLRSGRAVPMRPFTVVDGDKKLNFNVTWEVVQVTREIEQYNMKLTVKGYSFQRYFVVYTYLKGSSKPIELFDSVIFDGMPRIPGLFTALRSLAVKDVPLITVDLQDTISEKQIERFLTKGAVLAHSQLAITKMGRTTPDNFLWDESLVKKSYFRWKQGEGYFCINLDQFGSRPMAVRLEELFRQAKNVEMAYYDKPEEINITTERQTGLRKEFPDGQAILSLEDKFKSFQKEINGEKFENKDILLDSLKKQTARLRVLAKQADEVKKDGGMIVPSNGKTFDDILEASRLLGVNLDKYDLRNRVAKSKDEIQTYERFFNMDWNLLAMVFQKFLNNKRANIRHYYGYLDQKKHAVSFVAFIEAVSRIDTHGLMSFQSFLGNLLRSEKEVESLIAAGDKQYSVSDLILIREEIAFIRIFQLRWSRSEVETTETGGSVEGKDGAMISNDKIINGASLEEFVDWINRVNGGARMENLDRQAIELLDFIGIGPKDSVVGIGPDMNAKHLVFARLRKVEKVEAIQPSFYLGAAHGQSLRHALQPFVDQLGDFKIHEKEIQDADVRQGEFTVAILLDVLSGVDDREAEQIVRRTLEIIQDKGKIVVGEEEAGAIFNDLSLFRRVAGRLGYDEVNVVTQRGYLMALQINKRKDAAMNSVLMDRSKAVAYLAQHMHGPADANVPGYIYQSRQGDYLIRISDRISFDISHEGFWEEIKGDIEKARQETDNVLYPLKITMIYGENGFIEAIQLKFEPGQLFDNTVLSMKETVILLKEALQSLKTPQVSVRIWSDPNNYDRYLRENGLSTIESGDGAMTVKPNIVGVSFKIQDGIFKDINEFNNYFKMPNPHMVDIAGMIRWKSSFPEKEGDDLFRGIRVNVETLQRIMSTGLNPSKTYGYSDASTSPSWAAFYFFSPYGDPKEVPSTDFLCVIFQYSGKKYSDSESRTILPEDIDAVWIFDKKQGKFIKATGNGTQLTKPSSDLPAEASPERGTRKDAAMNGDGEMNSGKNQIQIMAPEETRPIPNGFVLLQILKNSDMLSAEQWDKIEAKAYPQRRSFHSMLKASGIGLTESLWNQLPERGAEPGSFYFEDSKTGINVEVSATVVDPTYSLFERKIKKYISLLKSRGGFSLVYRCSRDNRHKSIHSKPVRQGSNSRPPMDPRRPSDLVFNVYEIFRKEIDTLLDPTLEDEELQKNVSLILRKRMGLHYLLADLIQNVLEEGFLPYYQGVHFSNQSSLGFNDLKIGDSAQLTKPTADGAMTAIKLLDNPGIRNIFQRYPRLEAWFKEFLNPDHPLKREIFKRINNYSDEEVLSALKQILPLGTYDVNKGLHVRPVSDMRQLFIHPSGGAIDIPQAFAHINLVNTYDNIEKKKAAGIFRTQSPDIIIEHFYLVIRAVEILSRRTDWLLFEERDLDEFSELFQYLTLGNLSPQDKVFREDAIRFLSSSGLLLEMLLGQNPDNMLLKPEALAECLNQTDKKAVKESIGYYIDLLTKLEHTPAWEWELTRDSSPEEESRIKYRNNIELLKASLKIADAAQTVTGQKEGGINLNPAQMSMQIKGHGDDFRFEWNGQTFDSAQIIGVTFSIDSMIPVTNLPELLGLEAKPSDKLTQSPTGNAVML